MKTNALKIGEAYMAAWERKDIDEVGRYLHPQLHFKGPMMELHDRESFLASSRRILPMLEAFNVRTRFASENQAIFTYDFVCKEPVGVCRTAELITFDGAQIKSIELFYDARPFVQ